MAKVQQLEVLIAAVRLDVLGGLAAARAFEQVLAGLKDQDQRGRARRCKEA